MKKVFYLCSVMLGCAVGTSYGQGVQITSLAKNLDSCEYYSSPAGSLVTNIRGTTDEYLPGGRVRVHYGDGTSEDAYYWEPGQFGSFNAYATPGNYTVAAILYNEDDEPVDTFETTIDAYCKSIRVSEYFRGDANCEYDYGTDYLFSTGRMVEVKKAGVVVGTTAIGSYSEINIPEAELGVEFSIDLVGTIPGLDLVCESGSGFPYTFMLDTLQTDNNLIQLGYECNAGFTAFDMAGYMTGFLRYIENSYLILTASNLACSSEDAVVTLEISPKYEYVSSTVPPTSISGNTLTWNVSDLSLGTGAFYETITLNPATTLIAGDTATHVLTVTPTSGDSDPANNVFVFTDTIRAAYDPNNKLVSPAGDFAAGEKLTYTINFENLGNDTAWNIHILDVMDNNLDLSTFKVLSASHDHYYNFYDAEAGQKMLRVDFPRILLPDATHPNHNKGYIIYEVNAKESLTIGDKVENTAEIYFDINPAIVTNTTVNVIPNPMSLDKLSAEDGIRIFPNPTTGVVNVENKTKSNQTMTMVNTIGQVLRTVDLKTGTNTINISDLSAGIYYLIMETESGMRASKLVVN